MGDPLKPRGRGNWTPPSQATNNVRARAGSATQNDTGNAQATGDAGTSGSTSPTAGGHRLQLNNMSVQNVAPRQRPRSRALDKVNLPSFLGDRQGNRGRAPGTPRDYTLGSARETLNDVSSLREHAEIRARLRAGKSEVPEGGSPQRAAISEEARKAILLEADMIMAFLDTQSKKNHVALARIREEGAYMDADCDEKAQRDMASRIAQNCDHLGFELHQLMVVLNQLKAAFND